MSIELENVFIDALTFPHDEVGQPMFHITLRVMWTEVLGKYFGKLSVVVHPSWVTGSGVSEQVWLEPVRCST